MSEQQDQNRTGRRALFSGAGSHSDKEETLSLSEIAEIIRLINTGGYDLKDALPVFFPLIAHITELTRKAEGCNEECKSLTSRLLTADEMISHLKEEARQTVSERESYLNDLITSHTEFDRALEIFQYHDVPMVLTGPDRTVHDVNDAFCTLFSIARSEITTSHPPLNTYFPDEPKISGPDGEEYLVITLSPPIVPFDHEAESLVVLIKFTQIPFDAPPVPEVTNEYITEKKESRILSDITAEAFEQFPIPIAIINQYRTIIRSNREFSRLIGREKEIIHLRDIGSCGIGFEDGCIDTTLTDQNALQCSVIITHPDGSDFRTYIQIIPLAQNSDEQYAMIIGVRIGDDSNTDQPEAEGKNSKDFHRDSFIRMLMDLNPSATALLDSHARVLISNEGFSEITGLCPGDLTGTDVRDLGITIPDTVLSSDATEAQYLPGIIKIQSSWGIQESSGMVVPIGATDTDAVVILVLQPIEEPGPVKPSTEPVVKEKPVTPERENIPVPFLCTDFSGVIIRTNNAFLAMSGATTEQVVGHMRGELVSSGPDELKNLVISGNTRVVREIMSPSREESAENVYWYFDVSAEHEKIISLKSQISSLERDISVVKDHQQTSLTASYHDISSDQIDIVEFELNKERYAIDITMVREVVEMLPVTPLPRTPPYVIGIINLRGEVTHIIDLAILLGERPKKDRSGQKIIIIPSDVTRGEHVGIIVDNVQSVTEILGRHVSLLGDNITTQIKTHIKGIIKISHDDVLDKHAEASRKAMLVIWLDIQKILDDIQGAL